MILNKLSQSLINRDIAIEIAKEVMTRKNFCEIRRSKILFAISENQLIMERELYKLLYGS